MSSKLEYVHYVQMHRILHFRYNLGGLRMLSPVSDDFFLQQNLHRKKAFRHSKIRTWQQIGI